MGRKHHFWRELVAEFWTEELTDMAVELRRKGVGCKDIAIKIGAKSTMQVSSKLRRLGEYGKSRQTVVKEKSSLPDQSDAKTICTASISLGRWQKEDGGVPFAELKDHACRWPFAGPLEVATMFCGKEALSGSPYCERHTRKAWDRLKRLEMICTTAKAA
jgi:hypothetical protein